MVAQVITRADTLTGKLKQQEYFSDFLDSFAMTPIGNELGKVTNERAVTQSIMNLFFTNVGERLFNPLVGSGIFNDLFEINDGVTTTAIELNVQNTIKYFEPRAQLISVSAVSNEEHTINVTIVYALINNPTPITISFLLQRVR